MCWQWFLLSTGVILRAFRAWRIGVKQMQPFAPAPPPMPPDPFRTEVSQDGAAGKGRSRIQPLSLCWQLCKSTRDGRPVAPRSHNTSRLLKHFFVNLTRSHNSATLASGFQYLSYPLVRNSKGIRPVAQTMFWNVTCSCGSGLDEAVEPDAPSQRCLNSAKEMFRCNYFLSFQL